MARVNTVTHIMVMVMVIMLVMVMMMVMTLIWCLSNVQCPAYSHMAWRL